MFEPCPLCAAEGKTNTIRYYQINIDEALVNCENPECCYPFGSNASIPLTSDRSFKFSNRKRESQVRADVTSVSDSSLCFDYDLDLTDLPQAETLLLEGCNSRSDIDTDFDLTVDHLYDFDKSEAHDDIVQSTSGPTILNDASRPNKTYPTENVASSTQPLDDHSNIKIEILGDNQSVLDEKVISFTVANPTVTSRPIECVTNSKLAETILPGPKTAVKNGLNRYMQKSLYVATQVPPSTWQAMPSQSAVKVRTSYSKPRATFSKKQF